MSAREDLELYLETVFGNGTGFAHTAIGHGQYVNDKGKYDHKLFTGHHYAWPEDQERLARDLLRASAAGDDAYVCPYLMVADKRSKGAAAARLLVHADVDGQVPVDKVAELGGFVVGSGTAGHGHVYVPLSESVWGNVHEVLCRGLRDLLGDADAKVSDNDVLRPPGTLNYKPPTFGTADPALASWLLKPSGHRVDPRQLADALGITLPRNANVTPRTVVATTNTNVAVIDVDQLPPKVRGAVAEITVDRSVDTMRVVGACHDAGLTLPQARGVVQLRPDLAGRLAERTDDDVLTCWLKATDSRNARRRGQEWVEQLPDGSGSTTDDVVPVVAKADPRRWIDPKEGLHAADLAADVLSVAPLRRDLGDGIWAYLGGVWRPDRSSWVRQAVTDRLGNRSRPAHTAAVLHYLLGQLPTIEPAPISQFLNVRNGLLDWSTGVLCDHDPEVLSTVQLSATWDPDAVCPRVEAWLAEVLPADLLTPTDDGPGFVWELIGYLAVSGNPLHKAVLLFGSGRNGKGTFLRMVTALLGKQNVSSVDLHSLATNRFRAAELFGKVANIAGDLDGSWLESTAAFKAITGGDEVTAERKYAQPFDFTPFAVPVYSANKVFGTPDTSDGYLSRWIVVPFPHSFLGHEDRTLDDRLGDPDELDGVLVKAVAGLRALLARGNFPAVASVVEATERFADESDPIRAFTRDTTHPDPDGWIGREQAWTVYSAWIEDNGQRAKLGRGKLYAALETAGWRPHKVHGMRGFTGKALTVEVIPGLSGAHLEPAHAEPGAVGAARAARATLTPTRAPGGKGGEAALAAPTAPNDDHDHDHDHDHDAEKPGADLHQVPSCPDRGGPAPDPREEYAEIGRQAFATHVGTP